MNKTEPTLKRGDVVLVLFTNSDLTTAKTRPALIVQADDLNTGLSQVIIAMITSQLSRANHPSRVTILLDSLNGQNSGLLANSVVMTDNLATVKLPAIYRVIGYLSTEEIDQALRYTLSL
ncbi:type II toxin-antitoxin system PemK/MazF family toxin [Aphanothece sacrum]|nr:type II toxin-antitoxin system PemK/MazF family toxin [Aphanothece sacrum]GBF83250.1 transcriptional modulator of MazE/toxin, MazF [Aphanothece sacrum FPU3]